MRSRTVLTLAVLLASTAQAWSQTQDPPPAPRLPQETPQPEPVEEEWSYHFQATVVLQGRGAMESPYAGPHSLSANRENATSRRRCSWDGDSGRTRRSMSTISGQRELDPEAAALAGLRLEA